MAARTRPSSWWIWSTAITAVLVFLVCGVILWTFLPPVVFFPFFVFAGWVLLVLGAVWLTFASIGWFKYKALRWSAVAPIIVALTAGLVVNVRRVQPVTNGCLFFIEGGLFDSIGLGYFPDVAPSLREPRREGDIGYQEFDGDWYMFVQRF